MGVQSKDSNTMNFRCLFLAVLALLFSPFATSAAGLRSDGTSRSPSVRLWIDLVIEYKLGEKKIGVNGYSKTYEHEAATIISEKDKRGPRFSFKGGPDCQIVFDSVRLWERKE